MHHKGHLIKYRQLKIQKRQLFNQLTSEYTRWPAMQVNGVRRRRGDVWNYTRLHNLEVEQKKAYNGVLWECRHSVYSVTPS